MVFLSIIPPLQKLLWPGLMQWWKCIADCLRSLHLIWLILIQPTHTPRDQMINVYKPGVTHSKFLHIIIMDKRIACLWGWMIWYQFILAILISSAARLISFSALFPFYIQQIPAITRILLYGGWWTNVNPIMEGALAKASVMLDHSHLYWHPASLWIGQNGFMQGAFCWLLCPFFSNNHGILPLTW